MAVWQFKLRAIPAERACADNADVIRLSPEEVQEARLSLSPVEANALFVRLSAILPQTEAWSSALRIWGHEESDDVQVRLDGASIESVTLRLDVSHLRRELVSGLCAVAQDFGWLLATPEGAVLRPTTEAVICAILQSPAQRFVDDPETFFSGLPHTDDQSD